VRVFVTGATGFVGLHLVKALLERGDDVVCLVRDLDRAKLLLGDVAPQLVRGDLSDGETLRSGCEDAEIIYHSAGLTTARRRDEFFAINAEGTRHVLEAAAAAAPSLKRFVYVSSQAAAGPSTKGHPRVENDQPSAVSNYGASKLAGENEVRASSLPWTIIRPCAVYGPGDAAFLPVFKLLRLGVLPVLGSTKQELSMIHVVDLVKALLGAVAPTTECQTYFSSHPEIVDAKTFSKHISSAVAPNRRSRPLVFGLPPWVARALLTVTDTAAGLVGKSTFLSRDKGNEYLAEAWVCSPKKLEEGTGWRAEIAIEEGVRTTAGWYREHGWL
jgi:nucleoside-diphosphate-sugar epimerase